MLALGRITEFFRFLRQFFPPDLTPHYLSYVFAPNRDGPIVQTLSMALAGIFLAVVIALPLGIVIGARMPGWRLLYAVLGLVRSIPDLTLAIFCVIIVGLGTGAGMITLVIYYAVAMAKVFGEIFLSADPRPLNALRATGASRLSIASFGLIPLKLGDVLTYGVYELESAIRASVIVGAVGAGGIGTELVGSLNDFDYRRVTTLVLALVLVIVLVDRFCWLVRRHPIALAILPPAGLDLVGILLATFVCLPARSVHIFEDDAASSQGGAGARLAGSDPSDTGNRGGRHALRRNRCADCFAGSRARNCASNSGADYAAIAGFRAGGAGGCVGPAARGVPGRGAVGRRRRARASFIGSTG